MDLIFIKSNSYHRTTVVKCIPPYQLIQSRAIKVHRVAVVEKNVDPIINPRTIEETKEEVTPLFFVKYGEGRFLISLLFEDFSRDVNKDEIKRLLPPTIIKFVNEEIECYDCEHLAIRIPSIVRYK